MMVRNGANNTLSAEKDVEVHLHHYPALQPGQAVGGEEDIFLRFAHGLFSACDFQSSPTGLHINC